MTETVEAPSRPKGLVVDDDPIIRAFCSSLLEEEGFDCQVADGGAAAIHLLATQDVDLLVCDLVMRQPDGAAVIAAANGSARPPAVLVLTGLSEVDLAVRSLQTAGWPVLYKPLDPIEFSRAVAWAMHARRVESGGLARRQTEALYRIATAASSDPSPGVVVRDRVLAMTLFALRASSGSIMLASPAKAGPRSLSVVSSFGLPTGSYPPTLFGTGISGWVAETLRPVRLVGPSSNYPQFKGLPPKPGIAESMVAPIVFRRSVLGTISVNAATPGAFAVGDVAFLVAVADLLAGLFHREALERSREHQDRLAMLGQLSASVAHELNNPLACLAANVGLAHDLVRRGETSDAEMGELLSEATESIERMTSLVEGLRSSSRKGTGTKAGQQVEVNSLLQRAHVVVYPQLKHRVKVTIDEGSRQTVVVDPSRILQILINLLVNASQAVERDGWVILRSRDETGWAVLEVEDNGPGITADIAAQLFQPFFTTKTEGTGLGLSISRQIAIDHGGELTLVHRDGPGTCFRLRLPAVHPDPAPPDEKLPVRRKGTVLVVDDEKSLTRAMCRVLRSDFEVLDADCGKAAIRQAEGKQLDLILSDFSMPEINGVQMLRELRARGHQGPAALVTAVCDNPEVAEALTTGLVSCVIGKPWKPFLLLSEALRLSGSRGASHASRDRDATSFPELPQAGERGSRPVAVPESTT